MEIYNKEWDDSYKIKNNFLFYPTENIVRFINIYLRKKIWYNEFIDINGKKNDKVLDFWCWIWRNFYLLNDFEFIPYWIDISETAINYAKKNINYNWKKMHLEISNGKKLQFENEFFISIISHWVFDSMEFKCAIQNLIECERVLKKWWYIYIDLISWYDSNHEINFNWEEIVKNNFEKDTIQSYFNVEKIKLFVSYTNLIIEDLKLQKTYNILNNTYIWRYYLVLKK